MAQALVPELLCSDLPTTRAFFVDVLGFRVAYERPEDTFVYLTREGADVMFEQIDGPGRRWITGPLEKPFGRGMNLQIRIADASTLYAAVLERRSACVYLALEEKRYRCGALTSVVRQFVVQDPDGYLIRFSTDTADTGGAGAT